MPKEIQLYYNNLLLIFWTAPFETLLSIYVYKIKLNNQVTWMYKFFFVTEVNRKFWNLQNSKMHFLSAWSCKTSMNIIHQHFVWFLENLMDNTRHFVTTLDYFKTSIDWTYYATDGRSSVTLFQHISLPQSCLRLSVAKYETSELLMNWMRYLCPSSFTKHVESFTFYRI